MSEEAEKAKPAEVTEADTLAAQAHLMANLSIWLGRAQSPLPAVETGFTLEVRALSMYRGDGPFIRINGNSRHEARLTPAVIEALQTIGREIRTQQAEQAERARARLAAFNDGEITLLSYPATDGALVFSDDPGRVE